MIISGCRKIVGGRGEGVALVTSEPINFLAMVDAKTGRLTSARHQLHNRSIVGAVLVFPCSVGSSVGAYVIHSLRAYGTAPSAIVCSKADITTASGCAIAKIPVVNLPEGTPLSAVKDASLVTVDADGGTLTAKV